MNPSSTYKAVLAWFGFAEPDGGHRGNGHPHGEPGGHGHTHGMIDPTIATTERGIWAIKWSFVLLATTALFQVVVVLMTGSVALLADTIHNVGDAATAVPLWIAFRLARRKPNARFTYGLGRVEDLAGVVIVLIILFSAIVAGYEAIDRLLNPQPIQHLLWVTVAGVVGFLGNEAVAVFRIRVGRQINSAALVADGYHARTDGLTSLAVVAGALGVWLGYPLADPIVGLLITVAILGIVWQSGKAVFTRLLDGVEPGVADEMRHAAEHVPGIRRVADVRARWSGHRLIAELDVSLDADASLQAADAVATQIERELIQHMPELSAVRIRLRPHAADHEHAPQPVAVKGEMAEGALAIVETPVGERLWFTASRAAQGLQVSAEIQRDDGRVEILELIRATPDSDRFESSEVPAEPHEFEAKLTLKAQGRTETIAFRMVEPHAHHADRAPAHGH